MNKKSFQLILFMGMLALQQCTKPTTDQNQVPKVADRIPVTVVELKPGSAETIVQASGQFTTDDETYFAFKTGGIIDRIMVAEGDRVRKGQVLARLNPTEIEAQVGQAQLALEKAKRDFMRAENLYRDSVATLEQFQNARTAMEFAERQLSAAQFNRSYSEIRAMGNGFVLKKMANEGQVIASGAPVLVTNGAHQGRWLLRVGVSDREWASIREGDKAIITSDAIPGKTFEGRVSRRASGTDAGSGTFQVDLKVYEPAGLASGLFGNAMIRTTDQRPSWQIPYESLLDGDARSGYVFVTDDRKTVRKVQVTIDRIGKDRITVTSGLEGARYLVISGSAYLKDGSPIEVK